MKRKGNIHCVRSLMAICLLFSFLGIPRQLSPFSADSSLASGPVASEPAAATLPDPLPEPVELAATAPVTVPATPVASVPMQKSALAKSTRQERNKQAPASTETATRFRSFLHSFRHQRILPAEKPELHQVLQSLSESASGRDLITETFFSQDHPELSRTVYELILDTDLKNPQLLSALMERDYLEHDTAYKEQILDLIADLKAAESGFYSPDIERYLARQSQHPDQTIRSAAISQRLWHAASNPDRLTGLLSELLLDHSPEVREEVYEVIELRIASFRQSGYHRYPLSAALQSLLYADYLGVNAAERERVEELLVHLCGEEQSGCRS